MKKYFYLIAIALLAIQFQSCSKDDEAASISELEKKYFTIENAVYNNGAFPRATISEAIDGVDMSDQVMNGAMNFITILTKKEIQKLFIGVKNVPGFLEYKPNGTNSGDYNMYIVPVMMSQDYTGNSTMVMSAQTNDGDVTAPAEFPIFYIETMPGELEIKLGFSNDKDVDLHLYTPGGEHIYYNNRGGSFYTEDGDEITYGLDIDSNAACYIDGVNKENIYLPAELVESGTYTVIVDMYQNCDYSIPTSWSIVARYQGELIRPEKGSNPAMGIYPVGAIEGDHTVAMEFTINADNNAPRKLQPNSFKPAPLRDADRIKIQEAKL